MAHIFQQTQQAKKEEASVSSASAMLSDGPALGMAAGSGLSPEVADFLQGLDETERQCESVSQSVSRAESSRVESSWSCPLLFFFL